MRYFGILVLLLTQFAGTALAQTISLPVTGDNSIVMVDGEWSINDGDKGRMRIKGNQHIVAMAFDLAAIAGKEVQKATLVCHQGEHTISHVTISTIAAPWDEMRSNGLSAGVNDLNGWGYDGARFPAVCGGNSFTMTQQIVSELRDGKYHWDLPPDMIHAMAIGVAHGLAIHEHDADYGRNPTIYSREQSSRKPVLIVETKSATAATLSPPTNLKLVAVESTCGLLTLTAPDVGFAYEVTVDGQRVGSHNVPLVAAGKQQAITLRDLPPTLTTAGDHTVAVRTLGRFGETSQPAKLRGSIFVPLQIPNIQSVASSVNQIQNSRATKGIGVIPVTDKYDQSGNPVGNLPNGYQQNNAIYDGTKIRLTAAAGEVVGFQLLLRGTSQVSVAVEVSEPKFRVDLYEAKYVPAKGRMIPDPLVPLPDSIDLKPNELSVVVADIFVPFSERASTINGRVAISDGRFIPLEIEVLPFAIPKQATFYCEMNGYGLPDHVDEYYALQKVGYDHRVHSNILHYSHNNAAPGSRKSNLDMRLKSGRRMDNKRYDSVAPGDTKAYWEDFTEAFGPFLDGSWSADGHRGPIPAPGFYLTFHESWPLNCRQFFNGDPDAYQAFKHKPEYSQTYINVLQDFGRLARAKGWTQTGFHVYCNNKGSLADKSKAPWILDEPSAFWDYRALRYFGELTDAGRSAAPELNIRYRIDISRPEYCRSQLDDRRDLWVVSSSAFQNYQRLVTDRIERDNLTAWVYGTSNHVHESNRNIQAWALDAWKDGATGIVPWQTVNKSGNALTEADQLGIFIFSKNAAGETVIRHSLRLKAYREAQQLIEYLNLVRKKYDLSREQLREFVLKHVALDAEVQKTNNDDAGTTDYGRLSASSIESLRKSASELLKHSR